jgi:hypothetical protein
MQQLGAVVGDKVLPIVLVDLVVVQEMVLGAAVAEVAVAEVAVAVALQGPEVRAHQEVRELVVAVVAAPVDMAVAVAVAPVDLLPVLGLMVVVVAVERATMVVMHHQDPVVGVVALEVALVLFITADTADTDGYLSAASQLRILFIIQTA